MKVLHKCLLLLLVLLFFLCSPLLQEPDEPTMVDTTYVSDYSYRDFVHDNETALYIDSTLYEDVLLVVMLNKMKEGVFGRDVQEICPLEDYSLPDCNQAMRIQQIRDKIQTPYRIICLKEGKYYSFNADGTGKISPIGSDTKYTVLFIRMVPIGGKVEITVNVNANYEENFDLSVDDFNAAPSRMHE